MAPFDMPEKRRRSPTMGRRLVQLFGDLPLIEFGSKSA